MSELRVRSKVWLEVDGQAFLGDGRYRMLVAIERYGSINAAARELGISYRKIWAQLQAMAGSGTSAVVRVPLFVDQNEVIKVDTRSREYVSRVK